MVQAWRKEPIRSCDIDDCHNTLESWDLFHTYLPWDQCLQSMSRSVGLLGPIMQLSGGLRRRLRHVTTGYLPEYVRLDRYKPLRFGADISRPVMWLSTAFPRRETNSTKD